MPRLVTLPFCRVVTFGAWDESPRRRFAAYRCRSSLPRLLGHSVVDEFATLSSPVFFCSRVMVGKIYDAGLELAHRRSSELGIDEGWPPFVVALDGVSPEALSEVPTDWKERLLDAIQEPGPRSGEQRDEAFESRIVGEDRLQWARLGAADVLVTSAPLAPKQLARLCEASPSPFAIAVSEGQVVVASDRGASRAVRVVSEERLASLRASAKAMLAGQP